MAEKISIWAEEAPAPLGHYCQAVKLGERIYVSGQLPVDKQTGDIVKSKKPEDHCKQVLDNLTHIMQACGGQMSNIMQLTVYVTDLRLVEVYDKVSKEYFFFIPPARTVLQVAALPMKAHICVDAIAEIPPADPLERKML